MQAVQIAKNNINLFSEVLMINLCIDKKSILDVDESNIEDIKG